MHLYLGLGWMIVASTAFQLVTPTRFSWAAQANVGGGLVQMESITISTSQNHPEPPQISYTIDADEVQGGTEISSWLGRVDARTSLTVPAVNAVVEYSLMNTRGEIIASDLYIPGIKEKVVFNASNTIRALAYRDPRLVRWPNAELNELYQHFDQDPNFTSIEETLKSAKRIPADFEPVLNRIKKLTRDTAERYAREKGWLPDGK